jgi:hypothetical protein
MEVAQLTPVERRARGLHTAPKRTDEDTYWDSNQSLLHSAILRAQETPCDSAATMLAVALERHRLARGEYPTSLDALVPEFIAELPQDSCADDGRFIYRRLEPGKRQGSDAYHDGYRLYSVWSDGVDDGGQLSKDQDYSPSKRSN